MTKNILLALAQRGHRPNQSALVGNDDRWQDDFVPMELARWR
jgi:hypothetical protein